MRVATGLLVCLFLATQLSTAESRTQSVASARTRRGQPLCGPRVGYRTVAQSGKTRVFQPVRPDPDPERISLYACRSVRRVIWSLEDRFVGGYAERVVGIVDPYVKVRVSSGAGPGDNAEPMEVMNVRTGRRAIAAGSGGNSSFRQFQLSARGCWLYVAVTSTDTGTYLDINDGNGTLDSGPVADPKLLGCAASWTHDGQPRTATLEPGAMPYHLSHVRRFEASR